MSYRDHRKCEWGAYCVVRESQITCETSKLQVLAEIERLGGWVCKETFLLRRWGGDALDMTYLIIHI